jgi:spermidine synthase
VGDKPAVEVVETLMDLREPHRLQHPYARTMMAGFVLRPEARSCLLIGLGGGALVRFMQHHFPALSLDVVEIDPVVVEVARDYFGTRPAAGTRFIVEDAYRFVARSQARYDLVLVDAHLHPGEGTDSTGHPDRLKGEAFMRNLQARLAPGGVALFNMIEGRDSGSYVAAVRRAFHETLVFRPPGSGNLVVAATEAPVSGEQLSRRAQALDAQGGYGFSFQLLLVQITR